MACKATCPRRGIGGGWLGVEVTAADTYAGKRAGGVIPPPPPIFQPCLLCDAL